MKASVMLWIQEFERLKVEFCKVLFAFDCLQNLQIWNAASSRDSTNLSSNNNNENAPDAKVAREHRIVQNMKHLHQRMGPKGLCINIARDINTLFGNLVS